MLTLDPDPLSIALLGALLLFVVVQLVYHFVLYSRLLRFTTPETESGNWPPVSIIICARSEFENLQLLLPQLLEQNYPEFEIIVVDDASWDGTTSYLEELVKTEPRINAVFVTDDMKKYYQGKKLALSLGMKAAKHEHVLLTDADCLPASKDWIKHMMRPYLQNKETEIVLGFSPYSKDSGFTNLCSRLDSAYTGASYFSYALKQKPYMGVGRNLSYKKSLFFRVKGFASHLHIAPGDDDLFIQDAANKSNTAVCLHPDSFVNTQAKSSFRDWFKQKKRHNFVGKYYKTTHRRSLGFMIITHALLWLTFFANLFVFDSLGWALIIMGLYLLIKWPLMYQVFKKLQQTGLSVWVPVFDFFYLFYNLLFGTVTIFSRQKKW